MKHDMLMSGIDIDLINKEKLDMNGMINTLKKL